MAEQREIAVIFDFDGTLAEDSTAAFAKWRGIKRPEKEIYGAASDLVAQGWDPPLAYLMVLCEKVQERSGKPISRSDFVKFGKGFKPYVGVKEFLPGLRKKFESNKAFKEAELVLNYYVISGGVGDIIRSTSITGQFREIWACEFDYDAHGIVRRPKATVSFTEKTKYLFFVNKGISGADSRVAPYAVNAEFAPEARRVPFHHMVYVGDGPSDVPCMSIIKNAKPPGKTILVETDIHKPWELLGRGRPVQADYRRKGHARRVIEDAVFTIAEFVAATKLLEKRKQLDKNVGY